MADRKKKKKKSGSGLLGLSPKPEPVEQIDPKTKRIKVKKIEPNFTIKNTGSIEGMGDAAKIEGKPHSSPEGQHESRMRSLPLKVLEFKNGGSVRLARKGVGRAYGKNS